MLFKTKCNFRNFTLAAILGTVLYGCDNNSNGVTNTGGTLRPPVTGTFVDSPVDGIRYEGSNSGVMGVTGDTGIPGGFRVRATDTVSFSIGDLVLGTSFGIIGSGRIVTPAELAGDAEDGFNPRAIRIAQVLQSLDCDNNSSNGIDICDAIVSRLGDGTVDTASLQLALDEGTGFDTVFNNQITALTSGVTDRTTIVSAEQAQIELQAAVVDATGTEPPFGSIALEYLGNFRNPASEFDESAAEVVAYDPETRMVFVVNAQSGQIDIINLASPENPTLQVSIDVAADVAAARSELASASELGAANSVANSGGIMAVAIEADTKQDDGFVAFYQATDYSLLSVVKAGALPDMLTFTPDGSKVVVANEGEPSGDYLNDPEGSVSIIDLTAGAAGLMDSNVTQIRFTDFNQGGSRADEIGENDVRVSTHQSASVAQDLEPEYIAVSADSGTAYVALQENNAIAIIDLVNAEIKGIHGLGFKDYNEQGNGIDASNRDDMINITNWPVFGTYMPDTIAVYSFAGKDYVITANEGDGREYIFDTDDAGCTAANGIDFDDPECLVYLDEIRIRDLVDPDESAATINNDTIAAFTGATTDEDGDGIADLFENENLGRLKVITDLGVTDTDCLTGGQPDDSCVYTGLYSYGARSFTIFDTATGEVVFDSGDDFETITAEMFPEGFNSDNEENDSLDDRSDDKGPEPEALTLATIDGRSYTFVGLERVGGVMVYDITNPADASFIQYINPRDFDDTLEGFDIGDTGPESVVYISADDSPDGQALLLVGNEVSGTLGIYRINTVPAE